jgi:hypothetical protein
VVRTTNNTDVRELGAVLLVNDQSSLLISLNANVLESETVGVGSSTDGNENNVGVQGLFLASLRGFGADGDGGTTGVTLGDLGVGQELDSLYIMIILAVSRQRKPERVECTCLARIFWAALEISESMPGPPICPKNSTTVTSEPSRLQTEAYFVSLDQTSGA